MASATEIRWADLARFLSFFRISRAQMQNERRFEEAYITLDEAKNQPAQLLEHRYELVFQQMVRLGEGLLTLQELPVPDEASATLDAMDRARLLPARLIRILQALRPSRNTLQHNHSFTPASAVWQAAQSMDLHADAIVSALQAEFAKRGVTLPTFAGSRSKPGLG
jgi:hypothetical protein